MPHFSVAAVERCCARRHMTLSGPGTSLRRATTNRHHGLVTQEAPIHLKSSFPGQRTAIPNESVLWPESVTPQDSMIIAQPLPEKTPVIPSTLYRHHLPLLSLRKHTAVRNVFGTAFA